MRRVFLAGYAVALAFASGSARAQQSPPSGAPSSPPTGAGGAPTVVAPPSAGDAPPTSPGIRVITTDGAEFRGSLVEKIPGQYVTVLLATGEPRRIAWNAIARITGAEAEEVPSQKTVVRFEADDSRAQLEKFVGAWQPVCSTPCEGPLSLDGSFRIGGDGIKASEPFTLLADGRAVKINANVGTNGRAVLGGFLAIGGGIVAYVGALAFLLGAAVNTTDSGDVGTTSHDSSLRTSGGVVALAGAAAGITGLVILLNDKTDVHVTRGAGSARMPPRLKLAGPFELGSDGIRF
jgi:hypothetical protein